MTGSELADALRLVQCRIDQLWGLWGLDDDHDLTELIRAWKERAALLREVAAL